MTKVESEIVMDMLGTCENPPDMEVEELDYLGTRVGEHKPTPELQNSVSVPAKKRSSRGSPGSRGARAEAWVTRRRRSRPRKTGTETV